MVACGERLFGVYIVGQGRGPLFLQKCRPWKQVAKVIEEIKKTGVEVHNLIRAVPGVGNTVCFWTDSWAPNGPLYLRYPVLYGPERKKNVTFGERWGGSGGGTGMVFCWARVPSSGPEVVELQCLITEGQGYCNNGMVDKWSWSLETTGNFSGKSLRKVLQEKTFQNLDLSSEWNRWCPTKVNFLTWRLALNKLPTLDNLAKRNVQVGSMLCKFCGDSEETAEHLFVSCGLTQSIWEFVGSWCRLYGFFLFDVKDVLRFHKLARRSKSWKMAVYMVIQTTIWCVWRARNDATFNGKQPSARNLKEEIRVTAYIWLKNRAKVTELTWEKWHSFD